VILDELRTRIAARRADGQSLALLVVDLGVIGRIDAAWGYAIGDGVRARFAAMLRAEVLRPGDYLDDARREELAYILDTVQSEGVALLAADKILRALDTPVWVGEDEIYARPAIGIALFPGHGEDEVGLLRHARTACQATRGGSERVAVYTEAQERQSAEALLFDNRLRSAVTQEGLEQVFDPIAEFRTGLSRAPRACCGGATAPA